MGPFLWVQGPLREANWQWPAICHESFLLCWKREIYGFDQYLSLGLGISWLHSLGTLKQQRFFPLLLEEIPPCYSFSEGLGHRRNNLGSVSSLSPAFWVSCVPLFPSFPFSLSLHFSCSPTLCLSLPFSSYHLSLCFSILFNSINVD